MNFSLISQLLLEGSCPKGSKELYIGKGCSEYPLG